MHSLTINFGPTGTLWGLMFKSEESAQIAYDVLTGTRGEPTDDYNKTTSLIRLVDDFGQKVVLERSAIHGYVLEDMDVSGMAHVERTHHQARLQRTASKLAESDASLRQVGPAILNPGIGNGQWPRQ